MIGNFNWYRSGKTLKLAIYNTNTKITTSFNWNGRSTWIMRIKIHNYNRYVVMEMSSYPTVDLFQVWVSHFSFLCSFTKRCFDQFLRYSLYNRQHSCLYNGVNIEYSRSEEDLELTEIRRKKKNATKLESYIAWTALDNVNSFLIAQVLP